MGKHYKLPFSIVLERKYNNINIEDFLIDWKETESNRKERVINMDNGLHIELNKFQTYNMNFDEMVDLAVRYALSKQEFRKNISELIELKEKSK